METFPLDSRTIVLEWRGSEDRLYAFGKGAVQSGMLRSRVHNSGALPRCPRVRQKTASLPKGEGRGVCSGRVAICPGRNDLGFLPAEEASTVICPHHQGSSRRAAGSGTSQTREL